MRVDIRPMNSDDPDEIAAAHQIYNSAMAEDIADFPQTSRTEFEGRMRYPWPGSESHRWIAEVDGQPAGLLMLNLPILDNLHSADVDLVVHPSHRGRGAGTALYETAMDFARANNRNTLMGSFVTRLPDGPPRSARHEAFAEKVGVKSALPEVRRRLNLDTVDRSQWDSLIADARAHATGYSLVAWNDAAPEDLVAQVASLESRFVDEAPMGDLKLEAQKVDVARVRGGEETLRKRGGRSYQVGAVHDATGELAAWTHIAFEAGATEHAWQWTTLVHPAHRGHRLGILVKMDNLLRTLADEPGVRFIDTWNATENTHMIAINEAMGFRAVDGWVSWQHEI